MAGGVCVSASVPLVDFDGRSGEISLKKESSVTCNGSVVVVVVVVVMMH
jgi:hypothetical protein